MPSWGYHDNIMRMNSLENDVTACFKQDRGWERMYKDETGPVKAQVEGKMKGDFKTFQIDMAAKKKALHPSGPPPPSVSMVKPSSSTSSKRRKKSRSSSL